MSGKSPNINRYWADLVVEELIRLGVRHFFLAPGSRNAPLATAVAGNPSARSAMHFDERGTCFLALGCGQASEVPAVWITTSGTAVANGLPAVVEASQSCVPLILLTADRPFELRDAGANQAIDQIGIFGNYVRWFVDMPPPSADVPPEAILTTVDQAVAKALGAPAGPVHINLPFREPLAPAASDYQVDDRGIQRWLDGAEPYTQLIRGRPTTSETDLESIRVAVENTRRGLFVVGGLPNRSAGDEIVSLAERWQWPVVADITAQIRLGASSDLVVDAPHFVTKHAPYEPPDVVIRFGSRISSKPVNELLKTWETNVLAVVSDRVDRNDPIHAATHRIHAHSSEFCHAASSWSASPSAGWPEKWTGPDLRPILDGLTEAPQSLNEPVVARLVTQLIPSDHLLFLAGSMPIRDFDMFADGSGAPCRVCANRGASGIDGTVASAVGAAVATEKCATVAVGDLALLHDLNSLALLRRRRDVVVVLNNDGGGIFSFLPIADHPEVFESLFGTPHGFTFESAAAMFGLRYVRPQTVGAFSDAYRDALSDTRSTLIEVVTKRDENLRLHRDLEARIAALL